MKIKSSLLDYSFPGLPVDMWQADGTLFPYHKDFILKLLNSCYENYNLKNPEMWVKDVTIVGSTTTTKYIRTSDVDIHVLVDIDEFIKTNMPKASKQEALEKLDNTRKEFDRAKILLPLSERPAEFFFESLELNPANDELVGRYSILQNKWLKDPIYFAQDDDFETSRRKTVEEAKNLANELDASFSEIGRQIQRINELNEVLKAWPKDKRQLYYSKIQDKLDIIEEEIEKSIQIKQDLVDQRHKHQDPLSDNEIKFKFLARFNYFAIISDLKAISGEEAEITTKELPLIEKVINEASLNKQANYGHAYWIDPQGKIYTVRPRPPRENNKDLYTHGDWIADNEKLLQEQYGINSIEDYNEVTEKMYTDGWARIGDSGSSGSGYGITVGDLNFIPKGVDVALSQFYTGGELMVEGEFDHRTVSIDDPFPSIQKAVNKALSQKRVSSLNKLATENAYWIDPFGKFYKISDTHFQWVISNTKLLRDKYGIDTKSALSEYNTFYDTMLFNGWARIGDTAQGSYFGAAVADLRNIPNPIFDWAVKQNPKSITTIEDYTERNYVELSNEELAHGQKAVNKALQQKRMGSLKEAFEKETETDICVDLDRTIAQTAEYPAIGEPVKGAKETLKKLQDMGYSVIIYSCRGDTEEGLETVREYLDKHDIPYDSIFEGKKPFAKYYIDDHAIHFDSWDNVLKQVEKSDKTASLHVIAASRYWVDPSGITYTVDRSHEQWIYNNTKLLQDRYGLWKNHPEELYPEETDNINAIIPMMLKDGWSRVGDLFGKSRRFQGQGIEIADLANVPQSTFDFISNWQKDKYFMIEDLQKRFVELSVGDLMQDGQEVINSHLRSEKMVHASLPIVANYLPKTFWISPEGETYPVEFTHDDWVYKNLPLLKQKYNIDFKNLFGKSFEQKPDSVVKYLINNGWVRVASAGNGRDYVAEVDNIRQIPTHAIDYLLGGLSNDAVVVFENEDLTESVQVSKEELVRGQNAINRAIHTQIGASRVFSKKEIKSAYNPYENDSLKQGPPYAVYVGEQPGFEEFPALKLYNIFGDHPRFGSTVSEQTLRELGIPIKQEKQASSYDNYWIDPNGKMYQVQGTHTGWGKRNAEKLNKKFGYDLPLGRTDGHYYVDRLIDYGWVRIATTMGNAQFVIHLKDLNNIPSFVDDFIAEHFRGNVGIPIWVGNERMKTVTIYDPFPNIQDAVNKALRQPVIANALFTKQAQTKKVKQGDYSCLMALVPHDLAQEIVEFGVRTIPDDKIYLDEDGNLGRELESHITVKYGLLTNDAKDVRRSFNNEKPFKAKLGKVKHFQPPELPFDVLTVEVISEDLEKANKKVCDNFECAKGLVSDEYHPHITIAYVKRDTAKDYIGSDIFEGKELELDTLVFSPHKGNRTYFSISNDKESAFILEKINKFAVDWGESAWIDPNGKVYSLKDENGNYESHVDFILNSGLLPREDSLIYDMEDSESIINYMLNKGWSRYGDMGFSGTGVQVQNLHHIPESVFNYVSSVQGGVKDLVVADSKKYVIMSTGDFLQGQKAINKALSNKRLQSSLNKVASMDVGYWVDPSGQVYDTHGQGLVHNEWILANLEMLHDKYGLKIPRSLYNQRLKYYKTLETEEDNVDMPASDVVWQQMLQSGWVRVGDADEGLGVELNNFRAIPSFMDSLLAEDLRDGDWLQVEDINHNTVGIKYPFKSLQQAVNKSLSSPTKTASGNNFLPSLVQPANNEWQFQHGGDDVEIPVDPDAQSDETTDYAPCTTGKPRTKEVWRQFLSMFTKPISQKDEMKVESVYDKELEEIEKEELGEDQTLLEFQKDMYDPKKHDFPHNTTWDSLEQDMEPSKPLPVTYSPESNEEFLNQNSQDGFPWRFMRKPVGEWFSNQGEINNTLIEMLKNKEAAIDSLTTDITKTALTRQFALYIGGRLAIRTLTYAGALKIVKQRFPEDFKNGNFEIKREDFNVPLLGKQAGVQSASVPDYLMDEWKTDQINDDTDEEPYIDHQERDYPYGMQDAPQSTNDFPWAKDITPYVVRLDILYPGPDRPYPAGLMDYEVINLYDSLPMSDGIEKGNPE